MFGEGLDSCSIDELQQLETQLERSVTNIRARKVCFLTFSFIKSFLSRILDARTLFQR